MRNVKVSTILNALSQDGWVLMAQRGSHRQFKHPTKKGKVTVNGKPSDVIWEVYSTLLNLNRGWSSSDSILIKSPKTVIK